VKKYKILILNKYSLVIFVFCYTCFSKTKKKIVVMLELI